MNANNGTLRHSLSSLHMSFYTLNRHGMFVSVVFVCDDGKLRGRGTEREMNLGVEGSREKKRGGGESKRR